MMFTLTSFVYECLIIIFNSIGFDSQKQMHIYASLFINYDFIPDMYFAEEYFATSVAVDRYSNEVHSVIFETVISFHTIIMDKSDLRQFGFKLKTPSTSSASAEGESATSSVDIPAEKESVTTPIASDVENISSDNSKSNESELALTQKSKRKKPNKVRKYDPKYLEYGIISIDVDGLPRPFCLMCKKALANSSMFPKKLQDHLKRMHPKAQEKSLEYFSQLKTEHANQRTGINAFVHTGLKAIESSFSVAYEIAKSKKPYLIAEALIQPCLSEVGRIMFGGESAVEKIKTIPLSHQTIARRIEEMATDVKEQLISRLRKSVHFTLQFDESTDLTNQAILIGFVRYVHGEEIVEDIFCFCSLPDRTTGEKIFQAIDDIFRKYKLDWKSVIGLCTDGAGAMLGKNVGLAKRISEVANDGFVSSHCMLHREALASKKMSPILNETLEISVKMINNIRAHPLHSRKFSQICSESGSDHDTLLLHADVRWLSRGKVLARLFELRKEMCAYFEKYINEEKEKENQKKKRNTKKKPANPEEPPKPLPEEIFLEKLNDEEWMSTLAYLVDIFDFLNSLNIQTQGKNMNCFVQWNKIDAFKKKLAMWSDEMTKKKFTSFLSTNGLIAENPSISEYIQPIAKAHLQELINQFAKGFPPEKDPRQFYLWVVNPYLNVKEPNKLSPNEKNQLLGT